MLKKIHQVRSPHNRNWSTVSESDYVQSGFEKRIVERDLPTMAPNVVRQAIVTKFHGPTNSSGARIRAKADAGSVTVSFSYGQAGTDGAHRVANDALLKKLKWDNSEHYGQRIAGSLPGNGGYVYVELPGAVAAMHYALGELLQFVIGNRGAREGNPYSKPEVQEALRALFYARTGQEPIPGIHSVMDEADAWRIAESEGGK